MGNRFHSVTLDTDACKGCINCIKRCPTEAIRVRDGKAHIITERCIDCGECIRVCPHHAKKAVYDSLSIIDDYEYTIALPAPSLYGQFNNLDDKEIVLDALLKMGFDAVYEVAAAAEIVSDATRKLMKQGALKLPVISSHFSLTRLRTSPKSVSFAISPSAASILAKSSLKSVLRKSSSGTHWCS